LCEFRIRSLALKFETPPAYNTTHHISSQTRITLLQLQQVFGNSFDSINQLIVSLIRLFDMSTLSHKHKRKFKKSQDFTQRGPMKPVTAAHTKLQTLFQPPYDQQENVMATQELFTSREARSDSTTPSETAVDQRSSTWEGTSRPVTDEIIRQFPRNYMNTSEFLAAELIPSKSESSFVTAQEIVDTGSGSASNLSSVPQHRSSASEIPTAKPSPNFGFHLSSYPRHWPQEDSAGNSNGLSECSVGDESTPSTRHVLRARTESNTSLFFPMPPPEKSTIKHRPIESTSTTWAPPLYQPVIAYVLFHAYCPGSSGYPDEAPPHDSAYPYLRNIRPYEPVEVVHVDHKCPWFWLAKHPDEGYLGWITAHQFLQLDTAPMAYTASGTSSGFELCHSIEPARDQLGPSQASGSVSSFSLGASSSVDLSNLRGAFHGSTIHKSTADVNACVSRDTFSDPRSSPDIGRPNMPADIAEHRREQDVKVAARQATWKAKEMERQLNELREAASELLTPVSAIILSTRHARLFARS
jgi:hypothetical protein